MTAGSTLPLVFIYCCYKPRKPTVIFVPLSMFYVLDKIKVKASLWIKFSSCNSNLPIYSRFFCHVAMHMT